MKNGVQRDELNYDLGPPIHASAIQVDKTYYIRLSMVRKPNGFHRNGAEDY